VSKKERPHLYKKENICQTANESYMPHKTAAYNAVLVRVYEILSNGS